MSSVPGPMSGLRRGEGVQVVKIGDGAKRFVVDEEALRQILMRPDVRNRAVVVVSVAGAYRGGKSFILDFFLRYLNAPRASQQSGEWLGSEHQPLEGFHWRGGGERDTTGIHLWPEPILVNLENTGEKVAVLLMDTQGTFDSETTVGQNSTIFALSTLISSVQLYNLSGNIREDDLQHLQLFTEYGKLACDAGEKAFQTLIFLVRDWMNDYEHPHGFGGGESLLNLRLQTGPNQQKELREVREHIRSCFEQIKCFLTPHPGLSVASQKFDGSLRDITEKFRLALLELVPSLFDPGHLTPKLINGERVKAQDLVEYFTKYVDIFNSDDVPEALTIFKATAAACLQAAMREARELYESRMDSNVREEISVPASTLSAWHHAARDAAVDLYSGKKKLGAPEELEYHRDQLRKELDARISLYMWNNDAKVRSAVSRAKKVYEDTIAGTCDANTRLCLHPLDLKSLHSKALTAALTLFDSTRDVPQNVEDSERTSLLRGFEQHYENLCSINEQNNKGAVSEARDLYVSRMKQLMEVSGVSTNLLSEQHKSSLAAAEKFFHNQRNIKSERHNDVHMERLLEEINSCFVDFKKMNVNSNKLALQGAEYTYNNYITSAWGPQSCCFHPRALIDLHKKAVEVAVEQFLSNRAESEDDDYKEKLHKALENRYAELKKVNSYNNKLAVDQAFGLYTKKMDKHSSPSLVSVLIIPFIVKVAAALPQYHVKSMQAAELEFDSRRRGEKYSDDEYRELLMKKIDTAYSSYKNPLHALGRELGIPID